LPIAGVAQLIGGNALQNAAVLPFGKTLGQTGVNFVLGELQLLKGQQALTKAWA
jgi:hypothetical protein